MGASLVFTFVSRSWEGVALFMSATAPFVILSWIERTKNLELEDLKNDVKALKEVINGLSISIGMRK